jgi:hypothetical protein
MKKLILLLFIIGTAFIAQAQQLVTVSGNFSNNGVPQRNEMISLLYTANDSISPVFVMDTVYTDTLGNYTSSAVMPPSVNMGYVLLTTSDCYGSYQNAFLYYFPGFYNFVQNFTCQNNCDNYFIYHVDSAINGGYQVAFSAAKTNSKSSYTWSFGDGNVGAGENPSHNYAQGGTYLVTLTTVDSVRACTSVYTDSIFVRFFYNNCSSTFNYYPDSANTNTINLNATGLFNLSSIVTWDMGDNTVLLGQNVQHTYANSGAYNVCLTIVDTQNFCFTTYCDVVFAGNSSVPNCNADFKMFMIPDTVNQGSNIVYFGSIYSSPTSTYAWDFGDGNFANGNSNVLHVYANSGIYDVCAYVFDPIANCVDTVCKKIQLNGGNMRILGIDRTKLIELNSIFPNPTEGISYMSLTSLEPSLINLNIRGLDGRLLAKYDYMLEIGKNTIKLDLSQLEAGMYLVEILNDKTSVASKLLVR